MSVETQTVTARRKRAAALSLAVSSYRQEIVEIERVISKMESESARVNGGLEDQRMPCRRCGHFEWEHYDATCNGTCHRVTDSCDCGGFVDLSDWRPAAAVAHGDPIADGLTYAEHHALQAIEEKPF